MVLSQLLASYIEGISDDTFLTADSSVFSSSAGRHGCLCVLGVKRCLLCAVLWSLQVWLAALALAYVPLPLFVCKQATRGDGSHKECMYRLVCTTPPPLF